MKRLILSIIFMTMVVGIKAQDMAPVFVAMPDQYAPQLENAWRKDLIDLYNAGKEARLQNTMNGTSVLKKLTANYLHLQVTDQSEIELKLLPLVNDTQIICMINTVNGPVPDSRLSFFTTNWQPLVASDLFQTASSGWFFKEDADKNSEAFKQATSRLDMELVKYSLSPDSLTLTATYTTPLYLSAEERDKVMPFLSDKPKVYEWNKFNFK